MNLHHLKIIAVLFSITFVVNNCVQSQSFSNFENNNWNSTELAVGIEWHKALGFDERFESNQSYNAIEVDLKSADIEVKLLWFYDRTAILSMVANQVGALAAINGTYLEKNSQFFKSQDSVYQAISDSIDHPGYWMKEGAIYSSNTVGFDIDFASMGELIRMPYEDIISGGPILIDDYEPVGLNLIERPHETHENDRHPRTAFAVANDGQYLLFFTADGGAEEAEGLTTPELTELLKKDFAVSDALNLDGGGTTTMWIRGKTSTGVVNHPDNNGKFDQYGERWTGQAIAIFPKDSEKEDVVESEESCTAFFSDLDKGSEEHEQYIYLGDQINRLMDMPANQDFSISLWIKPEMNGKQNLTLFNKRIPNEDNPDFRRGYEAYINSEGHPVTIFDTGYELIKLKGKEKIKESVWNHLTVTVKSGEASLYVNGQLKAEEIDEDLNNGFANKFFLTAGAQRNWTSNLSEKHTYPYSPWGTPKFTFTDNPYVGEMDEFQVWHRALSASEVQMLSQRRLEGNPIPVDKNDLLSYWQFDEVEGSLARDITGNIHGTYMGNIIHQCE